MVSQHVTVQDETVQPPENYLNANSKARREISLSVSLTLTYMTDRSLNIMKLKAFPPLLTDR